MNTARDKEGKKSGGKSERNQKINKNNKNRGDERRGIKTGRR